MEIIQRTFKVEAPNECHDSFYQLQDIEKLNLGEDFRQNIEKVIFLTGNKNKLKELDGSLNLKHIKLSCPEVKIDLPEIQDSSILNIVQDKCLRAYERIIKEAEQRGRDEDSHGGGGAALEKQAIAVLVEDTCLNFQALGGMPGPYVKWFLEAIGPEGLFGMLAGFPNKSAEAVCIYALMMSHPQQQQQQQIDAATATRTIWFFQGLARGQIVEPRRASASDGWGWDPIFEEERSRLTFAEMGQEMKSKFSHRAQALTILRKFLGRQPHQF